jgi:tripartite-type tricarboxylate transporter receptor subunit TctC
MHIFENAYIFDQTAAAAARGGDMRIVLCALALAAASGAATAQDRYPSRPVSLLIPAAPGGITDIVGRAIAPALGRALGQPAVVVNRPGAGGSVAAAAVARGAADGYSVLVGINSLTTLPAQELVNGKPPAFQVDELVPIASLSTEPMMLVTRPDTDYRSFKDVLDAARKRPGAVPYSTTGVYGTYHVAIEMVARAVDARLLAVHYAGGGAAMRALLTKEVEISLVSRSVGLAQIQAGQLRPIVAWAQRRWDQLPNVPSLKDEGLDLGYDLITGLFVGRETPAPVVRTLRDATRAAVDDPQFRAAMEKLSAAITYTDGPEFDRVWKSEAARLAKVVEAIGKIE